MLIEFYNSVRCIYGTWDNFQKEKLYPGNDFEGNVMKPINTP